MERNSFHHYFRVSQERLTNKFTRLKYESQVVNPVYNPKISPGPAIVNISSKKLSYVEEKVLEQGPKFSFLPKQVPVADLIASLESSLHKCSALVSNPDTVRSCLINTLYNTSLKLPNSPNNAMEKSYDTKVLNKLRKDSSIIITKADKSNSIVIMNKTDYDGKIQSHLNDTTTYVKSTHDQTDQFAQK
ncbi:uncharacterized protein LOC136042965, partial [Artemia franciscana]|uniref:uncharacterized protein LOC136042965 n=1 Tax=Artemia franciscana TaxID=6661 RepID=UPI0032DBA6F6